MSEKICEVCGRAYAARPSQTSGGREICLECEINERKFQVAYEKLQKSSVLLARADDGGGAEVWETAGQLLTTVDVIKKEVWTITNKEDDPVIYEAAKKELMMLAGAQ